MTRESDIEKYLVKRAKFNGGEVRKVAWVGRDGAPDRLLMLPELKKPTPKVAAALRHFSIKPAPARPSITIWIELKRPGGKAKFPSNPHERKQAREHDRMRRMGQRVDVIDSFEGVDALFI